MTGVQDPVTGDHGWHWHSVLLIQSQSQSQRVCHKAVLCNSRDLLRAKTLADVTLVFEMTKRTSIVIASVTYILLRRYASQARGRHADDMVATGLSTISTAFALVLCHAGQGPMIRIEVKLAECATISHVDVPVAFIHGDVLR
eukprot:COSAG01_NODE_4176_length_5267_cov_34.739164_3_plen_143_part_00